MVPSSCQPDVVKEAGFSACSSRATEEPAPQNCGCLGSIRKGSQGAIHANNALQKTPRQKPVAIKASDVCYGEAKALPPQKLVF